ncbi:MAG: DUF1592 domain-containing protein [Pseudohongiellaceae bacterium]|uniref:Cytochrome c domain-containing protein n=1 Tax=OM182 bacterium MED-G28 TaxID=1986256 RepID=A0A2A5WBC5_9GAMM|nr:MAG: hypothetical protein CNF02_08390 [OM182 bacterium MED-G28]
MSPRILGFPWPRTALIQLLAVVSPLLLSSTTGAQSAGELLNTTINQYCLACHNDSLSTADVSFQNLDLSEVSNHGALQEKVLSQLRNRRMPPMEMPKPSEAVYNELVSWLESEIDELAATAPNPGRTDTFHRINRAEYANSVRDLLNINVDVEELLPADDIDAYGFDNMADVLTVSPALMERYLSAARKTARLAIGEEPLGPVSQIYEVPILLNQNDRMSDDLPFGSRGGVAMDHYFPVAGQYDLSLRLHRNYVNYIRGMGSQHEIEVRLDGKLIQSFAIGGQEPDVLQAPASYGGNQFGDREWEEYMLFADSNLRLRFEAEPGPHIVGLSFVRRFTEPEGVLQPPQSVFAAAINEMRDGDAAIEQAQITGPFDAAGPGDTPSRRAIFVCTPASNDLSSEEVCATEILSGLANRAYRRPLQQTDIDTLMDFYRIGRGDGQSGFDAGIQLAVERILISPDFLFRVEQDPLNVAPATDYELSDLELASRLSFFLWSSIPDEELLSIAERGELQNPDILEAQTQRMLGDPRSSALVKNFASQWLYLRNLRSLVPDAVEFPEFDENLRNAFRQESELYFESLLRDDRSVLDLLGAGYTYVNERLAKHYGIEGVYGSHFRRVDLEGELAQQRGGILGQGSLLTATSYANRTSPVLRGKWVLTNILGTPPPPPPADVPDLPENGADGQPATIRDRMIQHREDPNCAVCHLPMDPLGLALENFDAVGRWRDTGEANLAIDASGQLPNGTAFYGLNGLRNILLDRSDEFAGTVTEKLFAYAIGRPPEYFDKPTVRMITRSAALDNYSWSSIIMGIVKSAPFRTRRSES